MPIQCQGEVDPNPLGYWRQICVDEAPTPGSGWASTPGGYSEAGTPRDSSSAYGKLLISVRTTIE